MMGLYNSLRDGLLRTESAALKRRKKELIPPTVRKRERRLTSPITDESIGPLAKKRATKVQSQEQSPLISLPAEIRRMIWEEVFGGDVDVHVLWVTAKEFRVAGIWRREVKRIKRLGLLMSCRRL